MDPAPAPAKPAPVQAGDARDEGDTFFWPSVITVVVIFALCFLADQLGDASWVLMVVWLPLVYKYILASPPHISARILLLLALVLESPDDRPGNGYWVPPFRPLNVIFYAGLKYWTGITPLSFNLFSLLCLLLFLRARKIKPRGFVRPLPEALQMLKVFLITLFVYEVYGLLRGGQGQPSYWQIIQLVSLPICALAFLYSVRGPRDFRALGTVVVVAAVTKGLLVAWVYEVVCRPMNIKPFYATTHSDSVTFGIAILILASNLFEHRDKKSFWRFALIVPFIVIAIVMNNRRLAFVGVGAGVFTTFAIMKPSAFKKKLTRWALILAPFFAAYVKIGGESTNPLFAPAALINSVTNQTDTSSLTRDIENYNLTVTLRQHTILGPGFGFEYIEQVRAEDISQGFSLYKFIAHNSVLWLWSVVGLVGFTILWMVYAMQAFFASRGYRAGRTPVERAAGLVTLAATITEMSMDWGDMGLHSYTNLTMCGVCYAVAVKLCAVAEGSAATVPKPVPKKPTVASAAA
jgi:hypothetical protein